MSMLPQRVQAETGIGSMYYCNKYQGYTLVEMAVVLVIVALMLGGLFVPLSAQMDQRNFVETQRSLETARDALIGYALAHGRLPCPATTASNGIEKFDTAAGGNATNGICESFFNGFLPAATLGTYPVDNNGFAVDGWGKNAANRIRYAVSNTTVNAVTNPFTRNNGMKNAGIANIGNATLLYVCTGAPAGAGCTGATQLTATAVFVVYSVGKNAATGGAGADEVVNPNPVDSATGNDAVFVSHAPTAAAAPGGEFDDMVSWISSSLLIAKMIAAEQLP